jgi:F-box-like
MSISSFSQSNVLGADVLLMIFQHLEGEDLVNCEVVCRQWRDILLAGTPWRRLFHRKINYSPSWRKEQKTLEKNQTLQTEKYRDVCRKILQMERNWRIGNFEKSVYLVNESAAWDITISDGFVAWGLEDSENDEIGRGCAFLDTETMIITKFPLTCRCQVLDEMLVRWDDRKHSVIEVRDPKNSWIINVKKAEENDYDHRRLSFGSGLLLE